MSTLRHIGMAVALALSACVNGQSALPDFPHEDRVEIAGNHLVAASLKRNIGHAAWILAPTLAYVIYRYKPSDTASPIACAASFFLVGVGFHISAAGNERKAGMILQGKRPKPKPL